MAEDKSPQVQLAVSNTGAKEKATAGRPSVVSLNYPDKKSLQKAYMPFLSGGGLWACLVPESPHPRLPIRCS